MKSALDIIRQAIAATGLIHAKPTADAENAAAAAIGAEEAAPIAAPSTGDPELDALEAGLRSHGIRIRQSSDDEVEYSFAFTVRPADAEETVARAAHGEDTAPAPAALAQDDSVSALERARLECEATAEECRAKNKMACPYHGAQFMKAAILHHLAKCGAKTADVEIKSYAPGSFIATVKCVAAGKERKAVAKALNDFIAMKGIDPADYPEVDPTDYDPDKKSIEVPYELMDEDTEKPDFDPSAVPAAPPTPAKPAKAKKKPYVVGTKPDKPADPAPEPPPPTPPAEPPPSEPEPAPEPAPTPTPELAPEPAPGPEPTPMPEPEPTAPKLTVADVKERLSQLGDEYNEIYKSDFFAELAEREKSDPSFHSLCETIADKLPKTEEADVVRKAQRDCRDCFRSLNKLIADIGGMVPSDAALDLLEAHLARAESAVAAFRDARRAYEQKARDILAEASAARKYPSTDYDDVKPDMEAFADSVPAHVRLALDTAATAVETAKADVDALAYAASAADSPLLRKTVETQLAKAKTAHADALARYGKLRDAALGEIDDALSANERAVTNALTEAEKTDGASDSSDSSDSSSSDYGVQSMLAAIGAKEPKKMAELADGEKARAYAAKKAAAEKAFKEAHDVYEKYHATGSRKERRALLEEAHALLQTYSDAAEERDDAREDYLAELRAALPAPDPSAMDGVAMRKGETLDTYLARLKAEGRKIPVSLKKLTKLTKKRESECASEWGRTGYKPPTQDELQNLVDAVRANSAQATACVDYVVDLILKTHFKNLFETNVGEAYGSGGGCTRKQRRYNYMKGLFGYPPPSFAKAKDDEAVAAELEKYGCMIAKDPNPDEFSDTYSHYFTKDMTDEERKVYLSSHAGGAMIRFRKDSVMTTFMLDDSFAHTGYFGPSTLENPSLCGLMSASPEKIRELIDSGAYKNMTGHELAQHLSGSYMELQYHGAVGPECIESVNFQKRECLKTLSPESIDMIHRYGIKVYVKGKAVSV